MLSKYFEIKIASDGFKQHMEDILAELSGKQVLVYGAGEGFLYLNKIYKLSGRLNIVAIADEKFESENVDNIEGIKTIKPGSMNGESFDFILVTNEYSTPIYDFLQGELDIGKDKIKVLFEEEIKDERANINYLYEHKFDKTLPKLVKKLKDKKVVLYGAGVYLKLIQKYFDISGLNIIGIADKKYEIYRNEDIFLGYKTVAPSDIETLNPDYVIVATKFYITIIENLHYDTLHGSKIKIKPLVKKSLVTLIKEIWNS